MSLNSSSIPFLNGDNQDGRTALYWAASKGHLDIVALLLDRGADIAAADNVSDLICIVCCCD